MSAHQPHGAWTLVRQLGRGGHATVFEAVSGDRRVALKRPRPDIIARGPERLESFKREYHTLAQLAHPNIIAVHDFGIDDGGPYYTMELLEGGELRTLLPIAWPMACRILCDVAAALAMVHSRRLVHRDVSLHNVRLTEQGRAKLMDFGVMTPIGVPENTQGTAAYMPPEALYGQALDQRTDLYALGALGYRLISGRDAYPARRIDQLKDVWRTRPRALSELAAGVPPQLEALVAQLLSFNPAGRCRTAAEVLVRLRSIAGLDDADEHEIARAYLATPALIGRDHQLATVRTQLFQAVRVKGTALLVEGPTGGGRSRFLDACVLEGRLAEAEVLRARASGGSAGSCELIGVLGDQLMQFEGAFRNPESIPEVLKRHHMKGAGSGTLSEGFGELHQNLVNCLLDAASDRPLLLVIDDFHLADRDSAAVLVRLAHSASAHRLMLIASAPENVDGVAAAGVRLLRQGSTPLSLPSLNEAQTLELVRSLFDDVLNLQLAAKRIHEVARGNPQASVDLAEWLVDAGHVVHEGGAWLIPDTLSGLPLPSSLSEALRERLSLLSRDALLLGGAIALAGEAELRASDYGTLLDDEAGHRVHAALTTLLSAGVLVARANGYDLAQDAYRALFSQLLDEDKATVHRRIAQVCLARKQMDWAIYHLFHGDDRVRALQLLHERLREGLSPTHILHSLEERVDWLRAMRDYGRSTGRPAAETFLLDNELVKVAEIKVSLVREEVESLCHRYKELSGYNDWLSLPQDMEPVERIGTALKVASERHQQLAESEQVASPMEALRAMAGFISACLASAAANTEIELIRQLPPLAPFTPLSDALRMLATHVDAVGALVAGRFDVALEKFADVLAEVEGETGKRMEPKTAVRLRRHALISLGTLNAGLSRSLALDHADQLDAMATATGDHYAKSTAKSASLRIRHQYHLRRGNWKQAEHWRHEAELQKLTDHSAVFNPSGVYALSFIYATVGNVAGMHECLTQMREYSALSPGLHIWEQYMAAEYDRLRDAPEQALRQHIAVLEKVAGTHMAWVNSAFGALLCYESLGRLEEGKELGLRLLALVDAVGIKAIRGLILRPLSLLEARLGETETAIAHCMENIDVSRDLGMGGLNLGVAYENRARIAVWMNDREAFETYAALCTRQYEAGGGSPDLTARLNALFSEARKAGVVDDSLRSSELRPLNLSHAQVEVRDRLADCHDPETRRKQAMQAIVRSANAAGGCLFSVSEGGFSPLVSLNCDAPPDALRESAECAWRAALRAATLAAGDQGAALSESQDSTLTQTAGGTIIGDSQQTEPELPDLCGRGLGDWPAALSGPILFRTPEHGPVGVLFLKRDGVRPLMVHADLLEVVARTLVEAGDVLPPPETAEQEAHQTASKERKATSP